MKWGFLDDDSGYFYCIIYSFIGSLLTGQMGQKYSGLDSHFNSTKIGYFNPTLNGDFNPTLLG